jgi:DNA-binding NtrC family response regulator
MMEIPTDLHAGIPNPTSQDSRQRILVVDDEELMGSTYSAILIRAGFDLDVYKTTREVIERIQGQGKSSYCIGILDWWLNGESGLDLAGRIQEKDPELPVLIVTGSLPRQLEVYPSNIREFLLKPFRNGGLVEAIERYRRKI